MCPWFPVCALSGPLSLQFHCGWDICVEIFLKRWCHLAVNADQSHRRESTSGRWKCWALRGELLCRGKNVTFSIFSFSGNVCVQAWARVCVFQLIREGMEWENKRTRERWRGKSDGFLGFPASSVLLCAISWIIGPCQTGSTSGTVNLPDARTDF